MRYAISAGVLLAALALFAQTPEPPQGYTGSAACAACHLEIASSYRRVSMSRTFQRIEAAPSIEDWNGRNRIYHRASNQYFEMSRRDGRYFQRRYQLDDAGKEFNSFELGIDYAIGSGNHERDYLHRTENGELSQLPVVWYAETRSWGMAPGYDRPDHDGFSRRLNYRCVFCHTAYPKLPPGADRSESQIALFPQDPEAVDCERCHGPGARHATSTSPDDIVNPARLSRKLQLDICMQCHLETTSAPLPNSLLKLGRSVFSFRPGEALESYAAYFDYPKGSGHDDDFNIVHQAYRLRKSQCYLNSSLTCTTCHNPHQAAAQAVDFYRSRCLQCHNDHGCALSAQDRAANGDNCAACHMPKRRTDDIVHVIMTDHWIQRRPPAELLHPRNERLESPNNGSLVFYLPEPLGNLYQGMALTRGSDAEKGIAMLERAIQQQKPASAEPYFYLADAYQRTGRPDLAMERYKQGLAIDPSHAEARFNLAIVLLGQRRYGEARSALEESIRLKPQLANAHVALGVALAALGQTGAARTSYQAALKADTLNTLALDNLGLMELRAGHALEARAYFERALRINPNDLAARQALKR